MLHYRRKMVNRSKTKKPTDCRSTGRRQSLFNGCNPAISRWIYTKLYTNTHYICPMRASNSASFVILSLTWQCLTPSSTLLSCMHYRAILDRVIKGPDIVIERNWNQWFKIFYIKWLMLHFQLIISIITCDINMIFLQYTIHFHTSRIHFLTPRFNKFNPRGQQLTFLHFALTICRYEFHIAYYINKFTDICA